jgi:hypothetical protein
MPAKNLVSLIPAYSGLLADVRKQKKYMRRELLPEIEAARSHNDGSLDEEDFKKITNYYGFGVPAIVGEGFCTLREKPMSMRERMASTYQGALTGLYDDFFDKTHISLEEIRNMMDEPEAFLATSSLEKLFISFLTKTHAKLHNKEFFIQSFDKVFNAQIESSRQAGEDLSREEIRSITLKKGGYSLLFYRSVFSHPLFGGEEEALYHAGGLMQLGNDIFDVYKDDRGQIRTLVTTCSNIHDLRLLFLEQFDTTISFIKKIDAGEKGIQQYLRKFVLGNARCFVCLDQLESLQKRSEGRFSPSAYKRADLICDMEKPANIYSSLRYYTGYHF